MTTFPVTLVNNPVQSTVHVINVARVTIGAFISARWEKYYFSITFPSRSARASSWDVWEVMCVKVLRSSGSVLPLLLKCLIIERILERIKVVECSENGNFHVVLDVCEAIKRVRHRINHTTLWIWFSYATKRPCLKNTHRG